MTEVAPLQTEAPAPPATPLEARVALDAKMADRDFSARLLSGDAEANQSFRELQAKAAEPTDDVARAMAGDVVQHAAFLGGVADSGVKFMADTADLLREIGIAEPIVAETLRGHEVSAQEMKAVEAWRARQMKNPEFVKAYLSGEPEPRRLMTLSQIIVSGGVKEASAA